MGTELKPVTEMGFSELQALLDTLARRVPSYPRVPDSGDQLPDFERLHEVTHELLRRVFEVVRSRAALRSIAKFHEEMGMGRLPVEPPRTRWG